MSIPPNAFDQAGDYEALAEPLTAQVALEALRLAAIAPGDCVLDVAAGTGALALPAAAAGARVTATDLSSAMVERLRARAEAAGAAIQARVMDGQALDLPDGAFDAAFSIFGVFLFSDWRRGLAELARVARPGGRVVVAAWADPRGAAPALLMREALVAVTGRAPAMPDGVVALADPERLAAECAAAGLVDVRAHRTNAIWRAPSADWFATQAPRFFRWMPSYHELDNDAHAALANALRAAAARHEGPEGLAVSSPAWIAIGRPPGATA